MINIGYTNHTWLRSLDAEGANLPHGLVAGGLRHEVGHQLVGTLARLLREEFAVLLRDVDQRLDRLVVALLVPC